MAHNQPTKAGATSEGKDATMQAWERFLTGDSVPENAVRRMVEDSWRRCLGHGVNPIRCAAPLAAEGERLLTLQQRYIDLMEAARPVMAQAREFLAESGTMMILTDPQGIILSVEGDPRAKDNGRAIQLVPGALWTEQVSGTNAIGTALASGKPVQICAAEHFCEGVKHWTCSASVIYDPYDGAALGVLDISGLSGNHSTHCLALAVTAGGRVESRLAKLDMERRARLLDVALTRPERWGDSGVVVFDRRGRLVKANESAGLALRDMGLDLRACSDLRITAEGIEAPNDSAPLPEWVCRDWIEPVFDSTERLGTILALPHSQRRRVGGKATSRAKRDIGPNGAPMDRIIGSGATMTQVKARARKLSGLQVPVLLLGPTGTGKEVFARALHEAGPRANGPFVPLNCGSMTRDLLASELFGYAEGAFTGARRGGMTGKFEAADGGTLFLDEIGEMPLDLQAHLLRVLDEGEIYRLGENKPRRVQTRILAATNRDLRAEVAAGTFRMDLFYRLAVTVLRLPALADRPEDIPLLVNHFLREAAIRFEVPLKEARPDVMTALRAYPWPGNVRELRNVVEGMLLLATDDTLTRDDLPPEIEAPSVAVAAPMAAATVPVTVGRLADSERTVLMATITEEKGNLTRAALRLGIAKSTLYEKMKRHGIERTR